VQSPQATLAGFFFLSGGCAPQRCGAAANTRVVLRRLSLRLSDAFVCHEASQKAAGSKAKAAASGLVIQHYVERWHLSVLMSF